MLPLNLLYSEDHEWVRVEDDTAYIGLTIPLLNRLKQIVKLEIPLVGEEIEQTIECGLVEGKRTLKEIYAPLSGEVLEVNEEAIESPHIIFEDPYGDGWLLKIHIYDQDELISLLPGKEYQELIDDLDLDDLDNLGEEDE